MGYVKLLAWGLVFALFLGILQLHPSWWPALFVIPIVLIVAGVIYSMLATDKLYKKDPRAALLIGRLNYGIDSKGKTTHKFHLK
jgi:hypothetical protein